MHLTSISGRHIHGVLNYDIELGQRVLVAIGPNEAGKSSLLGLPALALVGPSGSAWPVLGKSPQYDFEATATFSDGGKLSIVTRSMVRGKHTGTVNGRKMSLAVFNGKAAEIGGEPARFKIADWLSLSPAKKFGELRGLLPPEAVNTAALQSLLDEQGVLAELADLWEVVPGWWSDLDAPATDTIERIDTDLHNVWLTSNQDADRLDKAVQQGLRDMEARGEIVGTPAAVQAKIDEVDETILSLRENLGQIRRDMESQQVARDRLQELESTTWKAQATVDLTSRQDALDAAKTEIATKTESVAAIRDRISACKAAVADLAERVRAGGTAARAEHDLATWEADHIRLCGLLDKLEARREKLLNDGVTEELLEVRQAEHRLATTAWQEASKALSDARSEYKGALEMSDLHLEESKLYRAAVAVAVGVDPMAVGGEARASIQRLIDVVKSIQGARGDLTDRKAKGAELAAAKEAAEEAMSDARSSMAAVSEMLNRKRDLLAQTEGDIQARQRQLEALRKPAPVQWPDGMDLDGLQSEIQKLEDQRAQLTRLEEAETRAWSALNAARQHQEKAEAALAQAKEQADRIARANARAEGEKQARDEEAAKLRSELAQVGDAGDEAQILDAIEAAKAEKKGLVTQKQALEDSAGAKAALKEHQSQLEASRKRRTAAGQLRNRLRALAQELYTQAIHELLAPASAVCRRVLGAELVLLPASKGSSQGVGVYLQRERSGEIETIPWDTASKSQKTTVASAMEVSMKVRMKAQSSGWRALEIDDLENLSGLGEHGESRRDAFLGALCDLVEAGLLDNVLVACVDDGWRPQDARAQIVELTR